ncbi:MAG: biotin/lipoyl-containing protein, partial [Candidatus Latescibacterota bacterium]
MAVEVQIPGMGESITEVILLEWLKAEGEYTSRDEPLCVLETDKANVDLPAPTAGVVRQLKAVGDTLTVGEVIARIEEGAAPAAPTPTTPATAAEPEATPAI